ncbi:hypothetical protein N7457_000588 [Penicillium paradoxum]|uniref:uncharacterized protein n=1 Tax=Penicillium paradoxum TaxID=176176 RepID=UPI00254765B9|nr:uncharacterized protein N7457_000588 [Penicillium paradoxum]KAJ5793989.1 hypothetical protein N7457_000588 [Penicillium paradoxum]
MKYTIPTMAILASLFSQTMALKNNEVYSIESPGSGDVWGIQSSIGIKYGVELVHPEGKEDEHWRFISSGSDFFLQHVYTQGMLGCPAAMKHRCEVDTLGNQAQLFTVTDNSDGTFTFRPSGSPLVLGTEEGSEVKARSSGPSVDAAFRLRRVASKCE